MAANVPSATASYWNATGEIALIIVHFLLGLLLLFGARRLSNLLKTVPDRPAIAPTNSAP